MAKCIKLQRKKTLICNGSLDKYIQIYERSIKAPVSSLTINPDYTEEFTILYNIWAMIETPKGKVVFDEIGTEKRVTHVFYIRYISGITSQNWIGYNDNRYDIERVTNLEENRWYYQLDAIFRGAIDKAASEA